MTPRAAPVRVGPRTAVLLAVATVAGLAAFVWPLLVLAGRVLGPGFGFALGATTLFASALLTGGVGPWLPFQVLGAAWVGLGAGPLPRARGRVDLVLLATYAAAAAFVFGLLLNLAVRPRPDHTAVLRRRRRPPRTRTPSCCTRSGRCWGGTWDGP